MVRLQMEYKDNSLTDEGSPKPPSEIYPEEFKDEWMKTKINYMMQNMELIGEDEKFII